MSEYTPITGELRAAMHQWGWVESDGSITFATTPFPPSIDVEQSLAISGSDFDRLCDAIDSIHARLERENESLKAELDRVLGEQENRDGWMELPKDADGVPIHVGDEVTCGGSVWQVTGLRLTGGFWGVCCTIFNDQGGSGTNVYPPSDLHHHQPDTWERIIEDAIRGDGCTYGCLEERFNAMVPALVARCKALCERTKEDA